MQTIFKNCEVLSREANDCDDSAGHRLLIDQVLIARKQYIDTVELGDAEKFAVLEAIPTFVGCGLDLMACDAVA